MKNNPQTITISANGIRANSSSDDSVPLPGVALQKIKLTYNRYFQTVSLHSTQRAATLNDNHDQI